MAAFYPRGLLAVCVMASAADLQIAITPGQVAETQITFSKADLQAGPALWVQADPNRIAVSVIAPTGQRYPGPRRDPNAPVLVQLADRRSGSDDEVSLARFLDADATLVGWNPAAPPGTYRIRFTGKDLSAPVQVSLRQTTGDTLAKERQAARKAREQQFEASLYAAPERRARLDEQGAGSLSFTADWLRDDLILIGSSYEGNWNAWVRLPDGTTVTEANARQAGCEWMGSTAAGGSLNLFTLKVSGKQVAVGCPERMRRGAITVGLSTAARPAAGELVSAVFRISALKKAIQQDDETRDRAVRTVFLRHIADARGQQGYLSAVAGATPVIRLGLMGGASPVATATVTAVSYTFAPNSEQNLRRFGPDPSKRLAGAPVTLARGGNGEFTYRFSGQQPGTHQVDFQAEGVFQNGRRFSAEEMVTVFVHRKAASVTRIRQQRSDRSNSGRPDTVRFLLDLDVIEPGRYRVDVQLGDAPNQTEYAHAENDLVPGKQTLVADGSASFVALMANNPGTRLNVRVVNLTRRGEKESPSEVVIDTAIPKAGEFESPAIAREGTTSAGGRWRLAGPELSVSVPVAADGSGCEWAATLEINPRQTRPGQLIRTVGYRQTGTFVPRNGKATIESRWKLGSFFTGGPPPAKQAFVFRLKQARCGDNPVSVESYEATADSQDDVYAMPFAVDLQGVTMAEAAGLAVVEPLDKDGDGKFDHLKVSFDLTSTGASCVWMGNIAIEGSEFGEGGHAKTQSGLNRVSMELDVTTSLSLRDQLRFRFNIPMVKCGANPQFSKQEIESMFEKQPIVFEQEFAIDSRRFAGPR